jgi:hypothetical protein
VEYNAGLAAEQDHQDGCPDESLREGAVLHPVQRRVAVYLLGIGAWDALAVAHRDAVVDVRRLEVRPDVGVERWVGRARVGQAQVASELRFARWPAEQRDAEAALYKRDVDQFAVRSCGAAERWALH